MDAIIRRRDKDILPGEWTWVLFHNVGCTSEPRRGPPGAVVVRTTAGHLFAFSANKYTLETFKPEVVWGGSLDYITDSTEWETPDEEETDDER